MTTKFDALKLANALAAVIGEAMHGIATQDDLLALEHRLEQKLTIRFGGMLIAGFGSLFAALRFFSH